MDKPFNYLRNMSTQTESDKSIKKLLYVAYTLTIPFFIFVIFPLLIILVLIIILVYPARKNKEFNIIKIKKKLFGTKINLEYSSKIMF